MNRYDEEATVVWKDRKRWCGLPWSFTRYGIIKKDGEYAKLVNITGLFSNATEEVNLYRVDDMDVFQSFTDKMFGVGTITVYVNDASCDKILLKKIKDPYKVRTMLNKLVIEDRKRVGFKHGEMQY
ncbi:MAG: PH domain-containing protein [Clostridia bacterium]|nr:PH domain-containing protein [Clostridia bacterium]